MIEYISSVKHGVVEYFESGQNAGFKSDSVSTFRRRLVQQRDAATALLGELDEWESDEEG